MGEVFFPLSLSGAVGLTRALRATGFVTLSFGSVRLCSSGEKFLEGWGFPGFPTMATTLLLQTFATQGVSLWSPAQP